MHGRAGTAIDTNAGAVAAARRTKVRGSRALPTPSLAVCCAVLAALAFVFGDVRLARAQSSSLSPSISSTLTPLSSPKGSITLVPNAQGISRLREYYTPSRPWWISYNDCIANDEFTFSLTVRNTSNPLEIWAGTENCAVSRSRTDRGQCWIVARVPQLTDTVDVTVPVRNIIARRLNVTEPPAPDSVSADVCDDSTDPSGEAITFYFMIEKGGQGDEYFAWDGGTGGTGFDVVGPEPPGSISVGVGESQLAVRIRNITEETDRERFEAFCVPQGTMRATSGSDAGAVSTPLSSDAGSDGGITTGTPGTVNDAGISSGAAPAACFTDLLVAGERPPAEYSCGTANETSRTLRTSRLRNYQTYAVAIAGQDNLGNAGVASAIQCGTPIELDDFYESYSRAGGPGGGGFCSFSPLGERRLGHGLGAVLLLLAGFAIRRRRCIA
jgi:hypothetical protein